MPRRHLLVLGLLVAVALTGCVDRSVQRDRITEYLNAGYEDRGVGCPFPVHAEATEGIAGVSGAHGFAVGGTGVVYVAFADRLETRTTDWGKGLTRGLDGAAEATRIAAGGGVVAVARDAGTNWTLTTYTPGLDPVANRTLGPDLGGLAVDGNGTVYVVDSPDEPGHEITVYDPAVPRLGEIDLEQIDERVHDLDTCDDRLLAVTGPATGTVAVFEADGTRVAADLVTPAAQVGVGHDLVFASGHLEGRQKLTVATVDGTGLLQLNNSQGRDYGSFEVAHGLVYNLRQDAILARPIPDYLTRPS